MAKANLTLGPRSINLVGRRFGRLVVTAYAGKRGNNHCLIWECLCDCGETSIVQGNVLKEGKTLSCGCYNRERAIECGTTHGLARSITYRSWWSMIGRCYDARNASFPKYGGVGVTVCDRWRESVVNFIADVGERPSLNYSIDRYPNGSGNYEPGNVRWATRRQQSGNRRNTISVTFNDETKTLSEWSSIYGISSKILERRLHYGWSPERAFLTPARKQNG